MHSLSCNPANTSCSVRSWPESGKPNSCFRADRGLPIEIVGPTSDRRSNVPPTEAFPPFSKKKRIRSGLASAKKIVFWVSEFHICVCVCVCVCYVIEIDQHQTHLVGDFKYGVLNRNLMSNL